MRTDVPGDLPVLALIYAKFTFSALLTHDFRVCPSASPMLIEVPEPELGYLDFKIDEPVLYGPQRSPSRGHFAGVNSMGLPLVFFDGKTSWTADTHQPLLAVWNCRKVDETKEQVTSPHNTTCGYDVKYSGSACMAFGVNADSTKDCMAIQSYDDAATSADSALAIDEPKAQAAAPSMRYPKVKQLTADGYYMAGDKNLPVGAEVMAQQSPGGKCVFVGWAPLMREPWVHVQGIEARVSHIRPVMKGE